MNILSLICTSDVITHPTHYYQELLSDTNEVSELRYRFGPHLIMVHASYTISELDKILHNHSISSTVRSMIAVAEMLKVLQKKKSIKDIKEILNQIYRLCDDISDFTISDSYQQIMTFIQSLKKAKRALESAILDYSPIVPYMGTIKAPEYVSWDEFLNQERENERMIHLQNIQSYLEDHMIEILLHHDSYLDTDDLSSNIIDTFSSDVTASHIYFLMVDVYFRGNHDQNMKGRLDLLLNLNSTYSKLTSGKECDIQKAIEDFLELTK